MQNTVRMRLALRYFVVSAFILFTFLQFQNDYCPLFQMGPLLWLILEMDRGNIQSSSGRRTPQFYLLWLMHSDNIAVFSLASKYLVMSSRFIILSMKLYWCKPRLNQQNLTHRHWEESWGYPWFREIFTQPSIEGLWLLSLMYPLPST